MYEEDDDGKIKTFFDYWNDGYYRWINYISNNQRKIMHAVQKSIAGTKKREGAIPENAKTNHASGRKDTK